MTMIERVAKAIYDRTNNYFGCDTWEGLPLDRRQSYLEDARAALECLKEPTEGMLEDGRAEIGCALGEMRNGFVAAIQAALDEGE